jgi:hypothetical protein
MKNFLMIILVIVRIYVFCKIIYLLYMTSQDPITYPIEMLTWWIYYLIFDIWLKSILPNEETKNNEEGT